MTNEQIIRLVFFFVSGITLIAKSEIHKWLDKENGYPVPIPPFLYPHPIYLLPYLKRINSKTKIAKITCNLLWMLFIISLIILFTLE